MDWRSLQSQRTNIISIVKITNLEGYIFQFEGGLVLGVAIGKGACDVVKIHMNIEIREKNEMV